MHSVPSPFAPDQRQNASSVRFRARPRWPAARDSVYGVSPKEVGRPVQPLRPYRDDAVAACSSAAATGETRSQVVAELDAVIAEIEGAAQGSRSLDARIHFGVRVMAGRGADMAAMLIREGISWPTVEAALDEAMPRYTTSLDAALEGERVIFVLRSETRGQWGAMQKAAGEEIMAWAATEALARRLVALKSWRAEMARAPEARPAGEPDWHSPGAQPGFIAEKERAEKDWEVLF